MNPTLASTLEPRQCQVCHTRTGLKRCKWCKLVFYCGREHQISNRASHKRRCKAVKKAVKVLGHEEHKLRTGQHSGALAGRNVFEDYVGRFVDIWDTTVDYMRALNNAADVMVVQFNNIDAVETALGHLTYLVRLCGIAPSNFRQRIASLYLRLGRDQECYNFFKWYATKANSIDPDWDDMEQPSLDLRDADALECPEGLWGGDLVDTCDIGDSVYVLLIKVRILFDLQHMQNATRAFQGFILPELIDEIRVQALVSGVVAARNDIVLASVERTWNLIQIIRGQIKLLFNAVERYSPGFWFLFVGPKPHHRQYWIIGDPSFKLEHHYEAWNETPGSIELIKSLIRARVRLLESSKELSKQSSEQ